MNISNIKKALPVYSLLVFFPCLFGLLLYIFILNIDKKQEIERVKSELSNRATDFMISSTPVNYFQPYFKKLANKLLPFTENKPDEKGYFMTQEDVSHEIKNCEEIFKDIKLRFVCAVFDTNANLINKHDLKDNESRFFTFIWKALLGIRSPRYHNKDLDQNAIIGREFFLDQLYGKDEYCMPTFTIGKTCVLYLKRISKKKNGVIVFVEHKNTGLPITDLTIAKDRVKDCSSLEHPIILYNVEAQKRETSMLGYKDIPYEKTNTKDFIKGFEENNIVWLGVNSDYYRILLGQKIQNYDSLKNRLIFSILLFLIILSTSTLFFFKNITNSKGLYVSIKYKLVFLFALAVYMPTLSLWVLSYTSLQDHRTAIENNVKRGMIDISNKIDSDYKKTEENVLNHFLKFDEYLKSFKGKKPPKFYNIEHKLKEIVGKNHRKGEIFNWIDMRHINLSQIYTTNGKISNDRLLKVGRVFAIICLEKYCPERLVHVGIKPSQSDIFIGNILENPIVGFASIFERPNQLSFSYFDGQGVYWWWNYYPEKDNPISYCIATCLLNETTISYFKTLLKERYTIENTQIEVINFNYGYQQFVPNINKNKKELLELINVSNLNKTIESTVIESDNQQYLCLCVPGSNLKDCFTILKYPTKSIDYKIEQIRSVIYRVMILILVVSIFTGLLLAKNFIIPVNELNRGLTALKKRETETVINIDNNDELGHLGNSFNLMMSDLKDMLLAGAIQQCLIPTGEYKTEGYDCVIYNQMAVDVGGDYADIFELPNNKLLIVIGDVTGHGVSSALLTAMVKASTFGFANDNIPLNEIVTQTSNMICDLLNKKKLMTFCAITIDKNTGEMAICNAGHPYPIIKEKEVGKIRTPCKTSLPMGLTKKRCRYNSEPEQLKPEETLFLYTDGFPEAEDHNGNEYSYEKFQQLIANSIITTSEAFKDNLIKIFKEFHGDSELADDITFIILRRKPLENN